MMLRWLGMASLCTALFAVAGCGASGSPKMTGTVTYNGTPIKEGRILFRATEGDMRAFSAPIENGEYKIEVLPGKMRVEVTASRPIPGKFDTSNPGEKVPIGEMYIPANYNSKSELTADVPAGGGTKNFELTGKK